MGRFLLRRLANYLVLIVVATTLAYCRRLGRAESRGPATRAATRRRRRRSSTQQLTAYGVNDKDPLIERYLHWIGGVLHGDFGKTVTGGSINDELGSRALVSLRLLLLGSIIGAVLGVLVGVVSAIKQYKFTDRFFTGVLVPLHRDAGVLHRGAAEVRRTAGQRGGRAARCSTTPATRPRASTPGSGARSRTRSAT